MAKHQFTLSEKWVVYLADGGKCFWCGSPVLYRDVQVDHVFPESLAEDPENLARIRAEFGLGSDFDLNGFENWVTCHQGCNLRKRASVLPNAPTTLFVVSQLKARAPELAKAAADYSSKRRGQEVLGKLASALDAGSISRDEIIAMIQDAPRVPIASSHAEVNFHITEDLHLVIANSPAAMVESQGWKIHFVSGNIAYVNDGRVGGVIPNVENPHPSWLCSRCGFYGPWDGIICRTCGNREEPDC